MPSGPAAAAARQFAALRSGSLPWASGPAAFSPTPAAGLCEPGHLCADQLVDLFCDWLWRSLVLIRGGATSFPWFLLRPFFFFLNFNGHITAHYAVGHMEWVGVFYIALFCFADIAHAGRRKNWLGSGGFGMALTMLAINLQGAVQFFLWSMAFLLLLAYLPCVLDFLQSRRYLRAYY